MGNFFILIVSSVASGIGWWIGAFIDLPTALVLSTIAGIVGVYFGWKWNRDLFSY